MIQRFTVQGRLGGLNEYTKACRANPHVGAKEKREQQEIVAWSIKAAHLRPMSGKVDISFVWYEPNRKRDHDNVAFAKKYILDALVSAGVLANDGWDYVDGFVDEFSIDRDNPRVEVTLRETSDDGTTRA